MKLYLPVVRLGSDRDYFPVADDGNEIQFYSSLAAAKKNSRAAIKSFGGEVVVLEFDAHNIAHKIGRKSERTRRRKSEWRNERVPVGKRLEMRFEQPKGLVYETVAWKAPDGSYREQVGKRHVAIPNNFSLLEWRPINVGKRKK